MAFTFGNNIFTYTAKEIIDDCIYFYNLDDQNTYATLDITEGLLTILRSDGGVIDEFPLSS